RAVNAVVSAGRNASQHSATGAFLANMGRELQATEPWQRVRLGGSIVFAATVIAGPLGYLAGQSWPTALLWTGTLLVSGAATLGAGHFAAAHLRDGRKDPRATY